MWGKKKPTHWNWCQNQNRNSKPHQSCKCIRLKLHFRRRLTKGFGARDSQTTTGCEGPTSKPVTTSPGRGVESRWPCGGWKLSEVTRMQCSEGVLRSTSCSVDEISKPPPGSEAGPSLPAKTCHMCTIALTGEHGLSRLALSPHVLTKSSSLAWAAVRIADVPLAGRLMAPRQFKQRCVHQAGLTGLPWPAPILPSFPMQVKAAYFKS